MHRRQRHTRAAHTCAATAAAEAPQVHYAFPAPQGVDAVLDDGLVVHLAMSGVHLSSFLYLIQAQAV
eukprot:964312-Pelagomonas_calceolata.AAC.3